MTSIDNDEVAQEVKNNKEILKTIRENLDDFHLENDDRFTYHIINEGERLDVEISLKGKLWR